MTIGQFFLGLLITGAGFIFVWRTQWIQSLVGYSEFGEKWFGSSQLLYKLVGVIVCFIGLLTAVGLIDEFINWFFGFLF
jgi:multisubunit Na+/H+ antiporter MnhB subunit